VEVPCEAFPQVTTLDIDDHQPFGVLGADEPGGGNRGGEGGDWKKKKKNSTPKRQRKKKKRPDPPVTSLSAGGVSGIKEQNLNYKSIWLMKRESNGEKDTPSRRGELTEKKPFCEHWQSISGWMVSEWQAERLREVWREFITGENARSRRGEQISMPVRI